MLQIIYLSIRDTWSIVVRHKILFMGEKKIPDIVFGLLGAFLENAEYISLHKYCENSQDE